MALEHVPSSRAEQDPAGSAAFDPDHPPRAIEEDDRDREPHRERVDRPTALDQERLARSESDASAEPPDPVAMHPRDRRLERLAPRGMDDRRSHLIEP